MMAPGRSGSSFRCSDPQQDTLNQSGMQVGLMGCNTEGGKVLKREEAGAQNFRCWKCLSGSCRCIVCHLKFSPLTPCSPHPCPASLNDTSHFRGGGLCQRRYLCKLGSFGPRLPVEQVWGLTTVYILTEKWPGISICFCSLERGRKGEGCHQICRAPETNNKKDSCVQWS